MRKLFFAITHWREVRRLRLVTRVGDVWPLTHDEAATVVFFTDRIVEIEVISNGVVLPMKWVDALRMLKNYSTDRYISEHILKSTPLYVSTYQQVEAGTDEQESEGDNEVW